MMMNFSLLLLSGSMMEPVKASTKKSQVISASTSLARGATSMGAKQRYQQSLLGALRQVGFGTGKQGFFGGRCRLVALVLRMIFHREFIGQNSMMVRVGNLGSYIFIFRTRVC